MEVGLFTKIPMNQRMPCPHPTLSLKMGPCLPEETKANRRNKRSYKTGQPRPEKEGLGSPGAGEAVSICGAIVGREDRKRQSAAGRGGMGTWSWGQPSGSAGSERPLKQAKRRRDDARSLRLCFISWCREHGCLACFHSLNTPVKLGCWQHTPLNPNTREVEQSSRTVRIETLSQSPWSTCQAS